MTWLRRNPKQYQPGELVRLVTTNDERSMLLTTSPFDVPSYIGRPQLVQYRYREHRRIEPIDPEEERIIFSESEGEPEGRPSRANNLQWPRPIIIPVQLVPIDFDDVDETGQPVPGRKLIQQSSHSFFPMNVSEGDAERFNDTLWPRRTYRLRCHVWSLWQKHLKDWWFFIRYPLAFSAALAYAIATVLHLSRSHP